MLQVLDDGRLTDSQGRTVDFRNTVIVMTSNLGSDRIQTMTGVASEEETKEAVMEVVGQHFRPELLNRLDDVVYFKPLQKNQIAGIANIQLAHLQKRLDDRGLVLDVSDEAMSLLIEAGYDPVYGARPLKRAVQRLLEDPLATAILQGKFIAGNTIMADVDSGQIRFASK